MAVTLEFLADISGATKEISGLGKSIDRQISSITSAFTGLTSVVAGFAAAVGVGLSFKSAIDQAAQYEDAVNQLATSLRLTGIESQSAVDGLVAFASEIQNTTRLSDDAVLSSASLLQSIARLSEEGLKKGTQAAIDLSAALRIDLESATRLVGKAAEGNVDAFKRYGIEIRKGKDDAETFSNTLETLNSRFGGSAVAATNTYAGAIDQLKNVFDDVLKQYGLTIIQNKEFIESIKTLTKSLIELVPLMVSFGNATVKTFNFLAKAITRSALQEELQGIRDTLKDANPASQDLIVKKSFGGNNQPASKGGLFSGAPRIDFEQIKKEKEARSKALIEEQNERDKIIKEQLQKESQERQKILNLSGSLVSNLSQGANGVTAAFQNVAGFFADTIIPGLGGFAATLVGFLAQGPEAVKAQIQAFIDNIPLIIDAIIESIPAVIEVLAANAPRIALSLANQMPVVATKLAASLISESPNIAKAFIQSLISESGRLIQTIADGVKNALKSAVGVGGGGGIGGGILGGVLGGPAGAITGGVLKKLKFAEGGIVPGGAPFTDRVPALLTPGEVVLNRQQVSEIQQERQAGQQNDRPLTVNLMIGEEKLANVILSLNRQGFRLA